MKTKLENIAKLQEQPRPFCELEVRDRETGEYVCQQTGNPCPYLNGFYKSDCEDYHLWVMSRIQRDGRGY